MVSIYMMQYMENKELRFKTDYRLICQLVLDR